MEPIIKAIDVQYCTLQCPDLDIQEQFLIHFGMHTVEKTEDMLLMKGDGTQPLLKKFLKEKRNLSVWRLSHHQWKTWKKLVKQKLSPM